MVSFRLAARRESGFTLLELMIVVAILAIIASVGVPQYVSALRIARVGKARQELITVAQAVDSFMANNAGQLPLTLHQVGFGGKRDPWGVPYCYLNYADGTGDGLQWAIDAGLVDPSAIKVAGVDGGTRSPAGARAREAIGGAETIDPVLLPAAFGRRAPQGLEGGGVVEEGGGGAGGRVGAAVAAVIAELPRAAALGEAADLTATLTRAGSFAVFAGVPAEVTRRRDRFMFPLNTDYDLFSLGPNARTTVSIGEALGQDDVIRANNGGFFGHASEY
jgi:general secretion pathway protein G